MRAEVVLGTVPRTLGHPIGRERPPWRSESDHRTLCHFTERRGGRSLQPRYVFFRRTRPSPSAMPPKARIQEAGSGTRAVGTLPTALVVVSSTFI